MARGRRRQRASKPSRLHKALQKDYFSAREWRASEGDRQHLTMRIAFDSRRASDPHGVGRYSRCLLHALQATAAPDAEIVQTHRPRGADVFHSPWMEGAMLHCPCPMVVTLHRLAALKRRSELLRMRPRLRQLAVQRAARVIAPTQALAIEALNRLELERERVAVIPEAADPVMHPRSPAQVAGARERYGLPERYLLWVGSLEHPDPTKHVAKLAATPRELPLVLVGDARPWARELPDVILTGPVGDEDLAAIYSGAHALLLPSEDEGFGLPAVEALACGTPVVACEGPALREVLGERATFVECGELGALISAAESATRPAPPAPIWSWEDAADATWRVYEQAAAEPNAARGLSGLRPRGLRPGKQALTGPGPG
jgi:glycosyltransferase involved in cell wall biosynthesis